MADLAFSSSVSRGVGGLVSAANTMVLKSKSDATMDLKKCITNFLWVKAGWRWNCIGFVRQLLHDSAATMKKALSNECKVLLFGLSIQFAPVILHFWWVLNPMNVEKGLTVRGGHENFYTILLICKMIAITYTVLLSFLSFTEVTYA